MIFLFLCIEISVFAYFSRSVMCICRFVFVFSLYFSACVQPNAAAQREVLCTTVSIIQMDSVISLSKCTMEQCTMRTYCSLDSHAAFREDIHGKITFIFSHCLGGRKAQIITPTHVSPSVHPSVRK